MTEETRSLLDFGALPVDPATHRPALLAAVAWACDGPDRVLVMPVGEWDLRPDALDAAANGDRK